MYRKVEDYPLCISGIAFYRIQEKDKPVLVSAVPLNDPEREVLFLDSDLSIYSSNMAKEQEIFIYNIIADNKEFLNA